MTDAATRIAELEERNAKLEQENEWLRNEVDSLSKTIVNMARGGGMGIPVPPPPVHHHHMPAPGPMPVAPGPMPGAPPVPAPVPAPPVPMQVVQMPVQAPPSASTTSPNKKARRTGARAKGEALKRHSKTPSRPPEREQQAEPLLPVKVEKHLAPPIETRKRSHTKEVAEVMEKTLAERWVDDDTKGSLIPAVWKPPGGVWERFTGSFGIGERAELGPEPPMKVQKASALSPSKPFRHSMTAYLIFNMLVRSDDVERLPAATLAAVARALCRLPEGQLNYIRQSYEGRPQPTHLISVLYKLITVLVWHSAEGVADLLEVCYRILKKQQGSDAVGQAEMLEVSARLSHVSPIDQQITHGPDGPPYSLPLASKRVQTLAQKIHTLLQSKMKD